MAVLIPTVLKNDMFNGLFGASGAHAQGDTYQVSLHPASAAITAASTWAGISGTQLAAANGYTQNQAVACTIDAANRRVTWADATWTSSNATGITARYAVLRNTSKSDKIVMVIDYGSDTTANNGGTFKADFPANDAYSIA